MYAISVYGYKDDMLPLGCTRCRLGLLGFEGAAYRNYSVGVITPCLCKNYACCICQNNQHDYPDRYFTHHNLNLLNYYPLKHIRP